MRDDPRHEREDALDLGPGDGARAHAAPSGAATRSSHVDDVGAHLGRVEHLGVLEEAEHEDAERAPGS